MSLPPRVAQLLRASVARPGVTPCADEVLASTHPEDLEGLAHAAALHGIAGYVHDAVRDHATVPEQERAQLKRLRDHAVLVHLRALADLRYLEQTLGESGISWVAMKGPTLAEPVHGRPELRTYGDLDVLVAPRQLGAAVRSLETANARMLDQNWTLIREERKGEVHFRLPSGTVLDLHWHFLNSAEHRAEFRIDTATVLSRAQRVSIGGRETPTLGAADTIVYVALHALLSGADRLIWLKDVERLLAAEQVPLEAISATASHWGVVLPFAAMLGRTDATLGLPPSVYDLRLPADGRAWRAFTRRVWRSTRPEVEDGTGSLGRLIARSTRQSTGASLRELARRSALHATHRLRGETTGPGRDRYDPNEPSSAAFPAGGLPERDAYLAEVEAEAEAATTPQGGHTG